MPLTVGSLFSGIGGLDLGLERAGMVVKWQVEIDPYCRKVLAKHWPDVECYEDVREVGAHNLEPVDLICGGFPCQPVSCAGQRKGTDDERWLWPEFHRLIRELEPRWVLGENVPGLLSIDAGRVFGGILRDLAASGYDAEWDCIPAAAVGAPHFRNRVFLIATPNDVVHVDGSGLQRAHDAAWRKHLQSVAEHLAEHIWDTTPRVCGRDDRLSYRMERIRALGNAVVPQVAEWIGRRIVEADKQATEGRDEMDHSDSHAAVPRAN